MLTAKQQRFCDEYLIDLNATQAAIRAGYSKKTANEQGSRLLANVSISNYITEKKKKSEKKLEISREMIIEGYRKLAFYDARKFYDEKGNLLNIPDLDDETAFALTGFEVMEEKGGNGKGNQVVLGFTKKIRMSERKSALDSICKMLGYNEPEKIDHTTKGESLNDTGIDNLGNDEKLMLFRLRQKMSGNKPVSGKKLANQNDEV